MIATLIAAGTLAALKHRWFYVQTNLQVQANAERLFELMRRGHNSGYNGIVLADSKIQIMDIATDTFRKNVRKAIELGNSLGIEIIPSIYSVGYASAYGVLNPNLIEGMPVKNANFVVRDRKADVLPDPSVSIKNPSFETSNGDRVSGSLFQDAIGTESFVDRSFVHSGKQSLRLENPKSNCRIAQTVSLSPWKQYRMSLWFKTENVKRLGEFRCFALAKSGKSLSFQTIVSKPTQDWTRFTCAFNSQEGGPVNVYAGVWGGFQGKIWIDDWSLEEVGLLNILRRKTAPLLVQDASGKTLNEGRDFESVADAEYLNARGSIDFAHPAPLIRLKPEAHLPDGTTLRVSFYSATSTEDGKTALSLQDPAALDALDHETKNAARLFGTQAGFMMQHDEIRIAGWDEPSQSAGAALAENLSKCRSMIRNVSTTCPIYVWSDMFDPFHNANGAYYLCNGSTSESWKNWPKDVTVVSWNSFDRKRSLVHFAALGCEQILAGYYDANPAAIADWLNDAKSVRGVTGVMYTTWQNNYADLEKFAFAAWGGK